MKLKFCPFRLAGQRYLSSESYNFDLMQCLSGHTNLIPACPNMKTTAVKKAWVAPPGDGSGDGGEGSEGGDGEDGDGAGSGPTSPPILPPTPPDRGPLAGASGSPSWGLPDTLFVGC